MCVGCRWHLTRAAGSRSAGASHATDLQHHPLGTAATKTRDAISRAIRAELPGGNEALDRLNYLSKGAMIARQQGDRVRLGATLADQDKAQAVVDAMSVQIMDKYKALATKGNA